MDEFKGTYLIKFTDGSNQKLRVERVLIHYTGAIIALITENGSILNFDHILLMAKISD